MVKKAVSEFVRHPAYLLLALFLPVISAIVIAYFQFYLPAKVAAETNANAQIVNAELAVAEAQAKLDAFQLIERQDLKPFFQQLVNSFKEEAWVKYLDYEDQQFKLLVINKRYVEKYGIYIVPFGKTASEAYSAERDLTAEELAALLIYQLNDRKAVITGVGHCIEAVEPAFPVKKTLPRKYKFRKCILLHGTQTYVFGRLVK